MARYGYVEKHRYELGQITLALGFTDSTTNPKWQYPAALESWDGDFLVSIPVPTGFGWEPEDPSFKVDGVWQSAALLRFWQENLHFARTIAVRGKGGIIRRKGIDGVVAPSVASRLQDLADQSAIQKAAALEAHKASVAETQAKAATEAEKFYAAIRTAKTYTGFSGTQAIISVEGEGPEAVVTLENKKGKLENVEAKWLQAGGLQALTF